MVSSSQPADAQRRLQAIDACLRQQGVDAATVLAQQALDAGVDHPLPLNLVAYRHEQAGRYGEARALLERALKLAPGDVFILNSLGLLHARQDDHAQALACFDAALRLKPDFPQARHSRGQSLEAVGEEAGAMVEYQRAAALHPRYAEPRASLALLHARRGEAELASGRAAEARAIEPGQALAGLALALVAMERGDPSRAETELNSLLEGSGLAAADRPTAWAMLGDALDAQGRTAEAFSAYERGKSEAGALHADRFATGERESELDFVRRLARELPDSLPSAGAGTFPAREHVFLLGFPRSGTTLLEQVLASHPDVETLDERDLLAEAEAELLRPLDGVARLGVLDDKVLEGHRLAYWRGVERLGRRVEGKVLVDKLPLHTTRLPLIARLFPQAKILFALRDPRDVVLSCFRRSFRVNASMYEFVSLERAAGFYDAVMTLGLLSRERSDMAVRETRYEDLVNDFDAQAQAICAFIGLEWDARLRDFAEAARQRVIRTPSAGQVRRGLYATGQGQWRRYAAEMAPVQAVLAPWLERFGYPGDA